MEKQTRLHVRQDGRVFVNGDVSSEPLSAFDSMAEKLNTKRRQLSDATSTHEKRQNLLAQLQSIIQERPRLSMFILFNLILSGVPLALFWLFALSVGLSSLTVGLLAGLFGSGLFTLACVSTALAVVIPTLCVTTVIACSLFFWAMIGLYLVQLANGFEDGRSKQTNGTESWSNEFRNAVNGTRKSEDDL